MSIFADEAPPSQAPVPATAPEVLRAALAAHDAGLSVVQVTEDGVKKPAGRWKPQQTKRHTRDKVERTFANGATGLGIVCGAVSGNLEMLEFEGRAIDEGIFAAFVERCDDHDLGDVLDRIEAGYCERTPSGGIHYLYRCDEVAGNTPLARRPATPGEIEEALAVDPDDEKPDKPRVLIETRGEGGFVVVAPSHGQVHDTGRPWELISGGFDSIVTITPDERDAIFAVALSLDEMPEHDAPPPPAPAPTTTAPSQFAAPGAGDLSPLDRYDRDHNGDEVLERAGFTLHHTDGSGRHYTRPGKDTRAGSSATVWADNGTTTMFSSSIAAPDEFIGNRNMRPSQLAAALLHGGDFGALARAVVEEERARGGEWATGPGAAPAPGEATPDDGAESTKVTTRFVDGGSFILDTPDQAEAVWGVGDRVLWAQGEPFMLCGPTGVGKTTVMAMVLMARLGILTFDPLGIPVQVSDRPTLYIAADRPNQIARAWRRCVTDEQRDLLAERLIVWRGPPPGDVTKSPGLLLEMAQQAGAGTVIVDSVKDIAAKFSDDEAGAAINSSLQLLVAEGIEVAVLHHQRKAQQGAKPKSIDDVYGSTWLTAGMGSVALLWGQPGDLVIELHHLKQPVGEVGPLKLEHDHRAGITTVARGFDSLRWLRNQPNGGTAMDAAKARFEKANPTDNERRKAQRDLERLVSEGLATKRDGSRGGAGGTTSARYYPNELAIGALGDVAA